MSNKRRTNTLRAVTAQPTIDKAAVMARTSDGFVNLVQRSGYGANNTLSEGSYAPVLLTRNRLKLEWMYRGAWIVGVAVDAIPQDMTRAGIEIHSEDDPSDIAKIQRSLTSKGIWGALLSNLRWGRLYGGSLAYIDIEGQDPATPLDASTVAAGQFNGLRVYDRWQLSPDVNHLVPFGPDAGLPEFYALTTMDSGNFGAPVSGVRFHHSRVIRSIGVELPFFQAITEQMWGESVLERMQDRLTAFDTASMGAANLLDRAYLRTVQVDGLREILSAGGKAEENLTTTMAAMRYMQSTEGLTLLDAKDTFAAHSYSFGGVDDIIMQFAQQIAGAIGVPMSRLFGQAPKGLAATGEGDMRIYHENINAAQESQLRVGLSKVLAVEYRSLFERDIPEECDFDFRPLSGLTDLDKVTLSGGTVTAVVAAFEAGVIDHETALKELKSSSETTGIFTNVSEQAIEEAQQEEPPEPAEMMPAGMPIGAPIAPDAEEDEPVKMVADSLWRRLTRRG